LPCGIGDGDVLDDLPNLPYTRGNISDILLDKGVVFSVGRDYSGYNQEVLSS